MHIEVKDIKPIDKGVVISSCSVRLPEIGLVLRDVVLMEKEGRRWFNMPSRTYEADGVKKYYSFIIFDDKEKNDSFQSDLRNAYDLASGASKKVVPLDDGLPF